MFIPAVEYHSLTSPTNNGHLTKHCGTQISREIGRSSQAPSGHPSPAHVAPFLARSRLHSSTVAAEPACSQRCVGPIGIERCRWDSGQHSVVISCIAWSTVLHCWLSWAVTHFCGGRAWSVTVVFSCIVDFGSRDVVSYPWSVSLVSHCMTVMVSLELLAA